MKTLAALLSMLCLASSAGAPNAEAEAASPPLRMLLGERIKHVFIIVQENHSFDQYFGTYPGAENYGTALARSHGLRQWDPVDKQWVGPYKITDPDVNSWPSNARDLSEAAFDGGKMDNFVNGEELVASREPLAPPDPNAATLAKATSQKYGLQTMANYDCDTLPFLWKYAHTFALFDNYFQADTGMSSLGNMEVFAAQIGQTQAAQGGQPSHMDHTLAGDPLANDEDPAFGPFSKKQQVAQTYATMPVLLDPAADGTVAAGPGGERYPHVVADLRAQAGSGRASIAWGWYQEGFTGDPNAGTPDYITHHNMPQYFDYLTQNDAFWRNVHGTAALDAAILDRTLPARGVFYIKGGNRNPYGWKPAAATTPTADGFGTVAPETYIGDDDHSGSTGSDQQLGEAFVAHWVNEIANSPYWHDSAIIVTWDDAGGFYDHVPPPTFENCPDGKPCGDGPRLPMIVISPYAKDGAIVHDLNDSNSVPKFIETVFHLPPLSSLPEEAKFMPAGPRDGNARLSDLSGAFDVAKLSGAASPIPASAATIPGYDSFPPAMSCKSLGITPLPISTTAPPGYLPRPNVHDAPSGGESKE
jgi:phospholipase C